jgi:hypothetical protein
MIRTLLLGVALSLSACASTDIEALTKHLNERNCATEGSLTISGVLPPTGYAKWDCAGGKPGDPPAP